MPGKVGKAARRKARRKATRRSRVPLLLGRRAMLEWEAAA